MGGLTFQNMFLFKPLSYRLIQNRQDDLATSRRPCGTRAGTGAGLAACGRVSNADTPRLCFHFAYLQGRLRLDFFIKCVTFAC